MNYYKNNGAGPQLSTTPVTTAGALRCATSRDASLRPAPLPSATTGKKIMNRLLMLDRRPVWCLQLIYLINKSLIFNYGFNTFNN